VGVKIGVLSCTKRTDWGCSNHVLMSIMMY